MSASTIPVRFRERGTNDLVSPLPFRYLSHDGLCAIDVAHAAGIFTDEIAPVDLKIAARIIISTCVIATKRGELNTGGLLAGLGQNKALAVRVISARPNTTCGPDNSGPPWESCRDVIDQMRANNERQVFGPYDDPRTTVPLPWRYTTGHHRCKITVDMVDHAPPGSLTTTDWYKVWAAANEVDFMCAQLGRNGTAGIVGEFAPYITACTRGSSIAEDLIRG
ncbi:MAG: hypothetical protein L6R40_008043 [Gallowayella cf. fulva]|nr:MAG: hypothetical protein L6R40_008043 [Xanthomendoza cf. fulva]